MEDLRKQIRSKTIGAKATFKTEIIEYDDVKIEVRQPSVATRAQMMKRSRDTSKVRSRASGKDAREVDAEDVLSTLDYGKMQAWACIYCAYVPGTDETVYEEQDFSGLLNQPSGGFVDKISEAAMNLMNVTPKEDAKN